MKITLFVLTIFVFRISTAQELSVSVSSGYNHKMAPSTFGVFLKDNFISAFYPYSVEYSTYSLGKGINSNIGINYTSKNNFGFQIEGSYLYGLSTTNVSDYYINDFIRKEIFSRYCRIIPQFNYIQKINNFELKFHVGAIINWGSFTLTQEQFDEEYNQGFKYVNKFSGGVSFGMITGISSIFKLNNRFSLFIDLNLISASHTPTKRKYIEMYHGETNMIDNFPTSVKETEYYNSYEAYTTSDPNSPSKSLKFKTPNSRIGLQIGVNFQLWKKADKND
ncbi:MAG: hypothetical protein ACK479_11385, partial [Fluviicola sp.]